MMNYVGRRVSWKRRYRGVDGSGYMRTSWGEGEGVVIGTFMNGRRHMEESGVTMMVSSTGNVGPLPFQTEDSGSETITKIYPGKVEDETTDHETMVIVESDQGGVSTHRLSMCRFFK